MEINNTKWFMELAHKYTLTDCRGHQRVVHCPSQMSMDMKYGREKWTLLCRKMYGDAGNRCAEESKPLKLQLPV